MNSHLLTRSHAHCYRFLLVLALAISVALGGLATDAQTPPTTAATVAATATPDNSVSSLNTPPPTPPPTATTAPTTVPTPAPTATATPTTAVTTPTGTPAATPAGSAAAPASATGSTPSPSPTTTATSGSPTASAASNDVDYQEIPNGGGSYNIVKVQNKTDNRLRIKAKIQLNHIPGDNVQPVNYAEAIGSCTNCQTFAVALQIDLRSRTATTVAPQNAAVALNIKCTGCTTVADAYQYVVPVDDPTQTPDNVKDLINHMQRELHAIADTPGIAATDAEARINAVIGQFTELAQSLYQQHGQTTDTDTPDATVPPDAVVLTPSDAPAGTPTTTASP